MFDAAGMRESVELETALKPLAARARQLADHVDMAIAKRRAQPATNTLTIYAIMKALARVRAHARIRDDVADLRVLINRRNPNKGKRKVKAADGATLDASPATTPAAPRAPAMHPGVTMIGITPPA